MPTKRKLPAKVNAEFERLVRMSRLDLDDPVVYLEARRMEYIKRIEQIADEALALGDRDIELKALAYLVRLTSVYKTRVDVAATNMGLLKPPDLSRLSPKELERLESAGESELKIVAGQITKEELN